MVGPPGFEPGTNTYYECTELNLYQFKSDVHVPP